MTGRNKPDQQFAITKHLPKIFRSPIIYSLLMGIITTIAIAWSLTLWHPIPTIDGDNWKTEYDPDSDTSRQDRYSFIEARDLGSLRRLSSPDPKGNWFFAKRPTQPWSILEQKPTNPNQLIIEDIRGWPLLALRSTFTGKTKKPGIQLESTSWKIVTLKHGLRIKPHHKQLDDFNPYDASLALPLQPIFPNFIIDTLIWGIFWFIITYPLSFIIFIPVMLRRYRRIRRNLCINCAYDLRGLSHQRCPECGATVLTSYQFDYHVLKNVRPAWLLIMTTLCLAIPLLVFIRRQSPWNVYEAVVFHDQNAIRAAAARGEDIDEVIIDKHSMGTTRITPLEQALLLGDINSVNTLIELGVDLYKYGSPLPFACYGGNTALVQVLLTKGADPNGSSVDRAQAFSNCITYGANAKMVQMMIDDDADLNPPPDKFPGSDPPLVAALNKFTINTEVIHLLVEAGADVNQTTPNTRSPLIAAADTEMLGRNKQEEIIKRSQIIQYLTQHGADVNQTDEDNYSPLHFAIHDCSFAAIQSLIKHGAVVQPINTDGELLLYRALSNPDPRVFDDLLSRPGFDINQQDEEGHTVLFTVVDYSYMWNSDTLHFLLDRGADPNAGDQSEYNILDLCDTETFRNIIQNAIKEKQDSEDQSP